MINWVARRAIGGSYWRRRSWKRAAMWIETEAGWHRRKKRQAIRRQVSSITGGPAGPSIPTSLMVPPFIITGIQGPFEVPGPLQVYTSSTYFEAPTVVNTMDAWNVLRTTVENFPLWWNRIR